MIAENLTPKQLADSHIDLATNECRAFVRDGKWREYLGSAYMGLIRAAERYKPNHAATFKTFATRRIRGAIQDQMRDETETRRRRPCKRFRPRRVDVLTSHSGLEVGYIDKTCDHISAADSAKRIAEDAQKTHRQEIADRISGGFNMIGRGYSMAEASRLVGWNTTNLHYYIKQLRTNPPD